MPRRVGGFAVPRAGPDDATAGYDGVASERRNRSSSSSASPCSPPAVGWEELFPRAAPPARSHAVWRPFPRRVPLTPRRAAACLQASNLCAHIAKGDVALSIIMTTATTVGVIFMTPLICASVLGTVVPVDAVGIMISTLRPNPSPLPRRP